MYVAGADFEPEVFKTVTFTRFTSNCTQQTFSLTILDDDIVEGVESLNLQASYLLMDQTGREDIVMSTTLSIAIQDNRDSESGVVNKRVSCKLVDCGCMANRNLQVVHACLTEVGFYSTGNMCNDPEGGLL